MLPFSLKERLNWDVGGFFRKNQLQLQSDTATGAARNNDASQKAASECCN